MIYVLYMQHFVNFDYYSEEFVQLLSNSKKQPDTSHYVQLFSHYPNHDKTLYFLDTSTGQMHETTTTTNETLNEVPVWKHNIQKPDVAELNHLLLQNGKYVITRDIEFYPIGLHRCLGGQARKL